MEVVYKAEDIKIDRLYDPLRNLPCYKAMIDKYSE